MGDVVVDAVSTDVIVTSNSSYIDAVSSDILMTEYGNGRVQEDSPTLQIIVR